MAIRSLRDSTWINRAACVGVNPEAFSSEDLPASGTSRRSSTAAAKAVCAACPVANDCLLYAIENQVDHGVWGGLTGQERLMLERPRRRRG